MLIACMALYVYFISRAAGPTSSRSLGAAVDGTAVRKQAALQSRATEVARNASLTGDKKDVAAAEAAVVAARGTELYVEGAGRRMSRSAVSCAPWFLVFVHRVDTAAGVGDAVQIRQVAQRRDSAASIAAAAAAVAEAASDDVVH